MLVIERRADVPAPAVERLVLPFELRCRSRLRTQLDSGEEVGVFLPRGGVLRGGDRLQANDGRIVEVIAAPEPLMEVRCADAAGLARFAYHLGNRHVAVQLGDGWLRFAADPVLARMLEGLGAQARQIVAPFEPEGGAYGDGHGHGHAHEHAQPVIHEFRR